MVDEKIITDMAAAIGRIEGQLNNGIKKDIKETRAEIEAIKRQIEKIPENCPGRAELKGHIAEHENTSKKRLRRASDKLIVIGLLLSGIFGVSGLIISIWGLL
jgi:hypothetical protein